MDNRHKHDINSTELRKLAEELVSEQKDQATEEIEAELPEEMRLMLHELRIHKTELEILNEDLWRAYAEAELNRKRYYDLFNLAPVGYCTIDEKGYIQEDNLSASRMLGLSCEDLEKEQLTNYIFREDCSIYRSHLQLLYDTGLPQVFELRMMKSDGTALFVRMELALLSGSNAVLIDDAAEEPVCLVLFTDVSDIRMVEALTVERKRLVTLLESFPGFIYLQAPDYTVRYANQYFIDRFGDPVGKLCYEILRNSSNPCESCIPLKVFETGKAQSWEWETANDRVYNVINHPFLDSDGSKLVLAIGLDITEERKAAASLRASEEKFRVMAETAYEGIWAQNADLKTNYVNQRMADMLGCLPEEIIGKKVDEFFFTADLKDHYTKMNRRKQGKSEIYERRLRRKDGSEIWTLISATPLMDEKGQFAGSFAMITDITRRKKSEDRIRYLSFNDTLTGLYNRTYLEEEMMRLDTKRQLPVSIIMADLNGLKLFNDIFGHSSGDQLLITVANILREACRKEEIIARWGGDEFIILLPQTTDAEAQKVCQRINSISSSVSVEGMPVSIALGTACKEKLSRRLADVMKEAEDNMYIHKQSESGKYKNAVLNIFVKSMEGNSFESTEHVKRMQNTAQKIAQELGFSDLEKERLNIAIKIHDIGKINISIELLTSAGVLTVAEWEEVKKHPETGYRMARALGEFTHIAEDVLFHHEKWDGSGYPRGIEGDDIPLFSRIIAIVDAYEVMSTGRPYKAAMSREEIIAEYKRCSGSQFDPELVKIMLKVMGEKKNSGTS